MGIMQTLFEITVYSAVIFTAIMLLKKVLGNRMSPRLHYAVWALLIMRLMLPVTIDSGLKLFTIPLPAQSQPQKQSSAGAEISENMEQINSAVASNTQGFISSPPAEADADSLKPAMQAASNKAAPVWNAGSILAAVWLAGMGASLIYVAFSYAFLRTRIKRAAAPAKGRLLKLFEQCNREMDIRGDIKVLSMEGIGTPALFIPSTVLIPAKMLLAADDEQITYALRHELTHYRRKDHIVSTLLVLLQAVYWFNPFVWLAFKQIRLDVEVACDSSVVKSMGSAERCRYASMIVSLSAVTKHRQFALGMARGNTKKAAEKRVRGIFTPNKSRGSAMLVTAVLAILLFVTCFTTACQPTPEMTVVAPKKETYEERETPTAQQGATADKLTRDDLGIPDHVTESYDMGNILSLNIDADVKTGSDLTLYKVYKGELKGFTQQQANHFADMFVKNIAMTGYDDRFTKSEITENFLLPARKTLSELENGTYVKDPNMDGDTPTVESTKELIKAFEQWITEAPEQRSNDSVNVDTYEKSNNYFYGEFPIEGSKITGKIIIGEGDRNVCGGFSYYNSSYDLKEPHNMRPEPISMALPEGGLGLKTTPDQAVELAVKIKNDLGADELELYGVMQAQAWVEELGTGKIDAYYVVFTRLFDDVPVLYTRETMANNAYGPGQTNEKLIVTIDDTGVIAVNWLGNTEITGVLNENPKFISFDDVLEAARKRVDATYSFSHDGGELREKQDVMINDISLEYLRMKEPNGGEGDVRFVPAWVFDGEYKIVYTDEAVKQNKAITEKEVNYPLDDPIVVNALDGSAFDPMFVDGIQPPPDVKPIAPKG